MLIASPIAHSFGCHRALMQKSLFAPVVLANFALKKDPLSWRV